MTEQTFLIITLVLLVAVVVLLLAFLSAVLWQLVKIFREVHGVMRDVRAGSDALYEDFSEVRTSLKRAVRYVGEKLAARMGVQTEPEAKDSAQ